MQLNSTCEVSVTFSVSSPRYFSVLSAAATCLTLLTLCYSCVFSIDCTEMQPSLSFVWALRGYDRFAVALTVAFSVGISPLFLAIIVKPGFKSSENNKIVILIIGTLITTVIPAIAVWDIHTGTGFLGTYFLHYFFLYCLVFFLAIWLCFLCCVLTRESESFNLMPLHRWIAATLLMLILTIAQWQVGFSVHRNMFFNELMFAGCQWVTIILGMYLPAKVSQAIGPFSLTISFPDFPPDDKSSIPEESLIN